MIIDELLVFRFSIMLDCSKSWIKRDCMYRERVIFEGWVNFVFSYYLDWIKNVSILELGIVWY